MGDLTSELAEDNLAVGIVALGRKTYQLLLEDGTTKIKTKGISKTDENAKLMDYTSMRGIISGSGFASIQTHNPCSFKRSVNSMSVATVPQSRTVRCTVRGRVIGQDFITYPYGYRELPFPVPGSPEHYLVNSIIANDPESENILRLERDFEKNSLQDYILERVS